jgi:phosphonate metabolism protein (transferase hexapeptide repeat family)
VSGDANPLHPSGTPRHSLSPSSPLLGVSAVPVNGDRAANTIDSDGNPKRLGPAPLIDPSSRVRNSVIGEWTWIGPNASIDETTFGDYSYVAGDAQIIYAVVGKWCSLASHVRLNPGNHPTWRVMQHHATYRRAQYGFSATDDEEFFQWRRDHAVTIGHDVWIGHGAVVMPGVTIGNGAVIGSSAVVTRDVNPYTVAVGVPARPIRERFPRAIADRIQAIAWWDWPRDVMESRIADFNDLDRFLEKYGD